MSNNSVLALRSAEIKQEAARLGFHACGMAKAEFLETEARNLEKWLQANMHGQMHYMANHFDKRTDPRLLVPGAKTVISLLVNYFPPKTQPNADIPKISKYAYGTDYHKVVKDKLYLLLQFIQQKYGAVSARVFTDSAPVLEKAWAKKAGIGWIGKNSNLLTSNGSFYFLGEIITDLEMEYDSPMEEKCANCKRCLIACPTRAIVSPGVVDGSKCISYFTIELRNGDIPEQYKNTFQNWAFGCDICQDVCPYNFRQTPSSITEFLPKSELLEMDKEQWTNLTETAFTQIFAHTPVTRAGYQNLKRNIRFTLFSKPETDTEKI